MKSHTNIFVGASGVDLAKLPRPLAMIVESLKTGKEASRGLGHDHYVDEASYDHTCQRPREIEKTR